jgi:hypothetical protein
MLDRGLLAAAFCMQVHMRLLNALNFTVTRWECLQVIINQHHLPYILGMLLSTHLHPCFCSCLALVQEQVLVCAPSNVGVDKLTGKIILWLSTHPHHMVLLLLTLPYTPLL